MTRTYDWGRVRRRFVATGHKGGPQGKPFAVFDRQASKIVASFKSAEAARKDAKRRNEKEETR